MFCDMSRICRSCDISNFTKLQPGQVAESKLVKGLFIVVLIAQVEFKEFYFLSYY